MNKSNIPWNENIDIKQESEEIDIAIHSDDSSIKIDQEKDIIEDPNYIQIDVNQEPENIIEETKEDDESESPRYYNNILSDHLKQHKVLFL